MSRLALVRKRDSTVVGNLMDANRPMWVTSPDGRKLASPAVAGWEDGDYRVAAVVDLVVPDGKRIVGAMTRTFDAASGAVVEQAALEDIPPERVPTDAERLEAATGLTVAQIKAVLGTVVR